MFQEFKKFAIKGNVMEMAIGVIIGGAFTQVVNSLVKDLLMPPIGMLTGGVDFSSLALTLQAATPTAPAVTLSYGLFVNTLLNFLIVSVAIFFLIRQVNRLKKHTPQWLAATPEDLQATSQNSDASAAEQLKILSEIRDLLKKKS